MAQKGYIIFSLDNRGSGAAAMHSKTPAALPPWARTRSFPTSRDGVQYLKSLPFIDANRNWYLGGGATAGT